MSEIVLFSSNNSVDKA